MTKGTEASEPLLRLFVVGVPRSGTTLLQSLLASHSALVSFTESHFFSRHYSPVPGTERAVLRRDPLPRLLEFLAENDEPEEAARSVERALGSSRLPPMLARAARSQPVALAFLGLLDQLARKREARGWVEKTPRHLHYLPWLDQLAEASRAHAVHILREGVDVVASLRSASRHWPESYDLETCVRRWNDDLERSFRRLSSRRDHFVFYDELTANPEAVMTRLLQEVGLFWEAELLDRRSGVVQAVMAEGETWKRGADRTIEASVATREALSASERMQVESTLHIDRFELLRERCAGRSIASTEEER